MLNPKRVRFLCVCVIVVLTLTAMGTVFAGAVQPRYSTSFSNVKSGEYTPGLTKTTPGASATIKVTSAGWSAQTHRGTTPVSGTVALTKNVAKSIPYNSGQGLTGYTYRAKLWCTFSYTASGTWDPA